VGGGSLNYANTLDPTQVGVYFNQPDRLDDGPYFGGADPSRTGCVEYGACMTGPARCSGMAAAGRCGDGAVDLGVWLRLCRTTEGA
jgi:hypothetical protein